MSDCCGIVHSAYDDRRHPHVMFAHSNFHSNMIRNLGHRPHSLWGGGIQRLGGV